MDSQDVACVKKKAERQGAILMYEDEASFQQNGTTTRTWAPVGEGFPVACHPCRRSEKAFGAISVDEKKPKWHFRFSERFNSSTFLEFLQQLVRNQRRKIYLILDNVSYHKTKMIMRWVNENRERIELVFLPAYSPDLNLVECVWKVTRRMATHNCYFPTQGDLRKKLFRRFNRFQGNPAPLRGIVAPYL